MFLWGLCHFEFTRLEGKSVDLCQRLRVHWLELLHSTRCTAVFVHVPGVLSPGRCLFAFWACLDGFDINFNTLFDNK